MSTRRRDPIKFAEIVLKLIPVEPPPQAVDHKTPQALDEHAERALRDIGCGDPTEGQVRLARDAYGAFVLALERMVSVSSCVRRSDRLRQLNFSTIGIFLIPRAIISIG